MEFTCRVTADAGMEFGGRNKALFQQYLREHPGALLKISSVLPESNKQRRYLEGAVIPLVAFYQEGMSHRSAGDLSKVREWLKQEFNGELVVVGGKQLLVGKSTKGRDALQPFLERIVDWLVENYQPPVEALDPEAFKRWRDTIFPTGGPDNYIDYLEAVGVLGS